jgi:rhodanese-related sulfurtransferase
MKQTVWLGLLLVVPLAAALLWAGSSDDRSRRVTVSTNVDSIDDQALSERQDLAKREAPPAPHVRDVRDTPRQDVAHIDMLPEIPQDEMGEENDPVEKNRRIRLPVILAIRSSHPTPEARREAMLEALRNSGPSDEAWTKQSSSVFDEWAGGIFPDVGRRPDFTTARCYQAGCEVELSFPNRASYERASKEFRALHEPGATHGGRVQTPAVEEDHGQVRASWIMLRPDDSHS